MPYGLSFIALRYRIQAIIAPHNKFMLYREMKKNGQTERSSKTLPTAEAKAKKGQDKPRETGGPSGLEPTRYGDWERKGRCIDF